MSSIGCLPGHVKLHDSLYDNAISQDIEQQTNDMLGGRLVSLAPASVGGVGYLQPRGHVSSSSRSI